MGEEIAVASRGGRRERGAGESYLHSLERDLADPSSPGSRGESD